MNVKMKAPEGVCSVAVNGVEHDISKGFVEVDPAHIPDLMPHGFEVVAEEEKPKRTRAAKATDETAPAESEQ